MESGRMTFTVVEAAKALGVSRNTAYGMARTGQLPALRLGRRVVIPRAALEKLLDVAATCAATGAEQ